MEFRRKEERTSRLPELDGVWGSWMEPGGLDSTDSLSLPAHAGVQKGHFRYSELILVPLSSTLLAHSQLGARGGVGAGKLGQKLLPGCVFWLWLQYQLCGDGVSLIL